MHCAPSATPCSRWHGAIQSVVCHQNSAVVDFFVCTLLFVQVSVLKESSHCKHVMGTLLWLNAVTLKGAPTPLFGRLVRCSAHGHSCETMVYTAACLPAREHHQWNFPASRVALMMMIFRSSLCFIIWKENEYYCQPPLCEAINFAELLHQLVTGSTKQSQFIDSHRQGGRD